MYWVFLLKKLKYPTISSFWPICLESPMYINVLTSSGPNAGKNFVFELEFFNYLII